MLAGCRTLKTFLHWPRPCFSIHILSEWPAILQGQIYWYFSNIGIIWYWIYTKLYMFLSNWNLTCKNNILLLNFWGHFESYIYYFFCFNDYAILRPTGEFTIHDGPYAVSFTCGTSFLKTIGKNNAHYGLHYKYLLIWVYGSPSDFTTLCNDQESFSLEIKINDWYTRMC